MNELAAPLPISPPAVSRHRKVLDRAERDRTGLVGQLPPPPADARPVADATCWVTDLRTVWTDHLDQLGALLAELQPSEDP